MEISKINKTISAPNNYHEFHNERLKESEERKNLSRVRASELELN